MPWLDCDICVRSRVGRGELGRECDRPLYTLDSVGCCACSCSRSSLAKTPQHNFMNDCPPREQAEMEERKYFSFPAIRSLWTKLKKH